MTDYLPPVIDQEQGEQQEQIPMPQFPPDLISTGCTQEDDERELPRICRKCGDGPVKVGVKQRTEWPQYIAGGTWAHCQPCDRWTFYPEDNGTEDLRLRQATSIPDDCPDCHTPFGFITNAERLKWPSWAGDISVMCVFCVLASCQPPTMEEMAMEDSEPAPEP